MRWISNIWASAVFWEGIEYSGLATVFIGVIIEYVAGFTKLSKNLQRKTQWEKFGTLILIVGLAVEFPGTVRTNQLNSAEIARVYSIGETAISDLHKIHSISARAIIEFSGDVNRLGPNYSYALPTQINLWDGLRTVDGFSCETDRASFTTAAPPLQYRGLVRCESIPIFDEILNQPISSLDGIDSLKIAFAQNVGRQSEARRSYATAISTVNRIRIDIVVNGVPLNSHTISASELQLQSSHTNGLPAGRNSIEFTFVVLTQYANETSLFDSKRDNKLTMDELLQVK